MTSFLAFAVLSVLSLAFVILDRRLWGFAISPGVVLTAGYTLVVGVYAVARTFYDFADVQWSTYAAVVAFTLACMLCSAAAAAFLRWRRAESRSEITGAGVTPRWLMLVTLALFLSLAVPASLNSGGLWSTDARESLSGGLVGHLHIVLAFATVWYALGTRDPSWLKVVLLLTALAALSLYPVKGWTMIPMTAVVFGLSQRSPSRASIWKYLPLLALAGVVVFFAIYLARAELDPQDDEVLVSVFEAIFEHFIFYLTAGLFGLDAVVNGLELNGGSTVLIAPLYNMVALVTGDPLVSPISEVFVVGMASHDAGGNVYSFLGSLIAYGGPWIGTLCALAIVTLAYLLLGIAWRLRSGPLRAAALYIVATLAYGWFEYYFWHLTPYEVMAIAVTAGTLSTLFKKHNTMSSSRTGPQPVRPQGLTSGTNAASVRL